MPVNPVWFTERMCALLGLQRIDVYTLLIVGLIGNL